MPTVASIIRKPDLSAWDSVPVTFRPASNTSYLSADIVRGYDIRKVTDASGFFSTQLAPGYYWVWIGILPPFVISVPDGDDFYLLKDLLYPGGSGAPSESITVGDNYRIQNNCLQLINASTGAWHSIAWSSITGAGAFAIGAAGVTLPGNYQITGGCLQLLHVDTDEWHAPVIASGPQLAQLAADEILADNYRVYNSMLQLRNTATSYYHSIFLYGDGQLAIGPTST